LTAIVRKLRRAAAAWSSPRPASRERFVIACSKFKRISDLIEGMALRNYDYLDQKSDATPKPFDVEVMGARCAGTAG